MMYLTVCALLCASPAFAENCAISLESPPQFVPDAADRARLVAKIMDNAGEGRHLGNIDGGNVNTHAYLIPHARTARFVELVRRIPGGREVDVMHQIYRPERHIFVGVLETEDEPVLTVVLFPRDAAEAMRRTRWKLNPTDAEGDELLRETLPTAWTDEGYFQSHHVL